MVENLLEEKRKKELETLQRAFESFTEVTRQLQNSYDRLQGRIQELDLELAQKNAALEQNLKEKEQVKNYLHHILESLTTGVVVVDRDGAITTFNKSAGELTGQASADCLGKNLRAVFPADFVNNAMLPLLRQREPGQSLDQTLITRGQRRLDIRLAASPMLGDNGEALGAVIILQDVTRLKHLEEELHRSQRMKAMGEMAAGIAHEIRNPLGSIELFASLLKKDLADEPQKQKLAEHISAGVKNMDRIISSILLFAKSPEPSRRRCDIVEMLNELLEFSASIMYPENVKITRNFSPEPLLGAGDADLLKQVFLNLIRNGIQAMPNGGELSISACRGGASGNAQPLVPERRRFLVITVRDTGTGIAPENLKKIFNPFFTTKDRGTGLGLAITYNIIRAHQGAIEVESEEGKGTAMIVKIPAWEE